MAAAIPPSSTAADFNARGFLFAVVALDKNQARRGSMHRIASPEASNPKLGRFSASSFSRTVQKKNSD